MIQMFPDIIGQVSSANANETKRIATQLFFLLKRMEKCYLNLVNYRLVTIFTT